MNRFSLEHRPRPGDRVLSISGRRLGTVDDVSSNGFRVEQGPERRWLSPSVVFTRQGTALTLICEAEGLNRFGLPAPVSQEERRDSRALPIGHNVSAVQPTATGLTEWQAQVLRLVRDGQTDREIAEKCGISRPTVRTILETIRVKLEASSRPRCRELPAKHANDESTARIVRRLLWDSALWNGQELARLRVEALRDARVVDDQPASEHAREELICSLFALAISVSAERLRAETETYKALSGLFDRLRDRAIMVNPN